MTRGESATAASGPSKAALEAMATTILTLADSWADGVARLD
jgi:hypothetical protein